MTMVGLKASWEVYGGLIPGHPVAEFTKKWFYTSEDFASDNALPDDFEGLSIFQTMMTEANDYHLQLQNPTVLNWTRLDFVWL